MASVAMLEKVPLFKNTTPQILKDLVGALVLVKYPEGEFVVRQGDIAKEMFFVINGIVEIVGAEGKVFDESGPGSFFGEMGLIYNTPRTASVRAKTVCELAKLSKEAFDSVKNQTPEFYEQVKETADTRKSKGILGIFKTPFGRRARSTTTNTPSIVTPINTEKLNEARNSPELTKNSPSSQGQAQVVENPLQRYDKQKLQTALSARDASIEEESITIPTSVLEKVPIFKGASQVVLNEIAKLLKAVRVPAGDFVVRLGQMAKEMFFVLNGTVEIVSGEGKVFDESGAGSFFGEMGLIFNQPRTASVRAKTDCELARLSKEAFDSVKDKYPELYEKVKELADTRKKGVMNIFKPIGSRIRAATSMKSKERLEPGDGKKHESHSRKGSEVVLDGSCDDVSKDSDDPSSDATQDSPRDQEAAIPTSMLVKVPIFQSTPPAGLADIAKALVPVKLSQGEFAIRYGQMAKEMFFVISGVVQIMSQEGKVFDESGAGSFFGEMGLIFNTPRTASVCAKTDCELALLNLEAFHRLMATYPEIYAKVKELADSRKEKGVRAMFKGFSPLSSSSHVRSRAAAGAGGWKHDHWSSKAKQKEEWPEEEVECLMFDVPSCKKEFMHLEAGTRGLKETPPEDLVLFEAERDTLYYSDILAKEKHTHYIGEDETMGHVIISIEGGDGKDDSAETFKAIIRTRQSDSRLLIHNQPGKAKKKCIYAMLPQFANVVLQQVDDVEITNQLIKFEQVHIVKNFKFGVLYCKDGQTQEDEMFLNENGSEDWEEFLDFLGERIVLQGWKNFRGGLDVSRNTTGTHSVYTQHSGMEIMFHVSTLLPFTPGDQQQVERKRHLGNDIMMVIFVEGDQKINPAVFRTQFIQVWMVVRKIGSNPTRYRIEVANKAGVPPYKPRIVESATYEKNNATRDFLLLKLINGERAALSGPEFKTKNTRTRGEYLKSLVEIAKKKM